MRFDCIQSQPGPHRGPLLPAEGGFQSPRQVALSALFLSSGVLSRREGPELLPSLQLFPSTPSHFPTRQLVVFLQHSLKKPVVQLPSSEQRFPPPSLFPEEGPGGVEGVEGQMLQRERELSLPFSHLSASFLFSFGPLESQRLFLSQVTVNPREGPALSVTVEEKGALKAEGVGLPAAHCQGRVAA